MVSGSEKGDSEAFKGIDRRGGRLILGIGINISKGKKGLLRAEVRKRRPAETMHPVLKGGCERRGGAVALGAASRLERCRARRVRDAG